MPFPTHKPAINYLITNTTHKPIISMNSDPFIDKKGTLDSLATALASIVLPQPGGPVRIAPLGGLAPSTLYFSGCLR